MSNIRDVEDFGEDDCPCMCSCGNWFDLDDGNPCADCPTLFCSDCVEEPWDKCPGCKQ